MSELFYAEDLDHQVCDNPRCPEDHGSGPLHLYGLCHPKAGTTAVYTPGSGCLRLLCARCAQSIADVAVAYRSDLLARTPPPLKGEASPDGRGVEGRALMSEQASPSGKEPAAAEALRLWQEWFAEDGDPLEYSDELGWRCFFCWGSSDAAGVPGGVSHHADNCIYIRAQRLVRRAEQEQG
jgi:hypothetical protein